ncbi:hypothetical protein CDV31_010439 [Fusarium ambrosium]|uniref:Uncharacterized protein n=1 Tax=Fusarium ambrosium TaxID=131363 RepID=A0A428TNA8_9HYPO|nr:hypothetical protein CDV31_010439 [Fusarium ambrosium]
MAEALAAVGVAASLVQLTDVSIRTCLYLYAFFSSLHNSQPDLHRHILVIKDVHDAIQLIRKTVSCQKLTEAEGRALGDQLNNVEEELSSLERATAGKDPTTLRTRVTWVLKSAETERALQRLENHKTTLVLLLQALNLSQSERILYSQTSTQTHLRCLVEEQKRHGAAMRSEVGKGVEELAIRMGSLDSTFGLCQQSLKEGFSNMSHEIQVSEEHVGNMLRHELQRQLRPLVEEALTKSEIQNAAALEQFRAVVDDAATQITRNISRQGDREKQFAVLETGSTSNLHNSAVPEQHFQHSMMTRPVAGRQSENSLDICPTSLTHVSHTWRSTIVAAFSHWGSIPHVGTFRVEYKTHTEPNRRFCTFKIDFWPSIIFFRRRNLSLKYSSRPDGQGYISLCPSLAVRPIISDHDPIWDMIRDDDVYAVTSRFYECKNGPFDQDDHGRSLLMRAANWGGYQVAQFLINHGADPTQTTACGKDCLTALLGQAVFQAVMPPPCACYGGSIETNFDLFAVAFHSFIAVGCDIEDCEITIFDVLLHPGFESVPHNRWEESDEDDWETDSETSDRDSPSEPKCEITDEEDHNDNDGLDDTDHNHDAPPPKADQERYLADIRRLAEFLGRQGLDLLHQTTFELTQVLDESQRMALPVLQQCGLDGNYANPVRDTMKPIIYTAMVFPDSVIGELDNLVSIISTGADIYTVEWADDFWVGDVEPDGVMSPTAYAKATGMVEEWEEALRRAGYDPREVFIEDERRRREFRLRQGVKSSAVEVFPDCSELSVRKRRV